MKEIIITSSILICAMLLMRLFFRGKVSRRLIYASWLLVALRLLIPVQLGHFSFSVLNQVENVTGIVDNVAKEPVSGASREEIYQDVLEDYVSSGQQIFIPEVQDKIDTALPDISFEEIYNSLPEKGENIILPEIKEEIEVKVQQSITVPTLGQIAKSIWILGMGAMLIWFASVNILFNGKLKKASETIEIADSPVPVRISPLLSSPCLFGFLKPTVYLTHNCREDGQVRRHVLTHELTHLKHKDHIWSLVRCICLCVYWFNPLVWVAAFVSKRDCELACDEAVLQQLGESERLNYGKTLVDMVATNPTAANLLETATAMHETKKALKERVNHIVKKKKHLLISALCLILVLSIVTGCSFAGKKDSNPTTDPSDPAGTAEPGGTTAPPETSVPPATEVPTPTPPTPEFNAGLYTWIIDEEFRDYTGQVRFYSAFKLTQGMQDMIDEFNTYYPNIEVVLKTGTGSSSSGYLKPNVMLEQGEIDVFHSFSAGYTYERWADGLFRDITDRLMAEGIDMVTNWGTDAYHYNGRYYSIPCGGLQYYITINMTAWEEAGLGKIPTEWTWDEYIEASRKMTKTNEDGSIRYGGSSYSSINTIMYCGAQVSGGDLYFSANGTKTNYDDPVVIKAFERELKAELDDKIWFPLYTYRSEGRKDYDTFLKGECASTVTCNVVRYIHSYEYDATRNFVTAFAPFPTEEAGQTNYMAGVHNYSHVAIAANCQDETAAWLFAKFFSTYGAKYLVKAGHQSAWRGSDTSEYLNILYGSEEKAKKYIDVESFKHVIGRTDLPAFQETVNALSGATYTEVAGFLKDPLMKALQGEISAEVCLKQAAMEADTFIADVLGISPPYATPEGASPENPSKGLYYRVNLDGKTCTVISSGTCVDKEFYVPSVIDGYTVTAIGDGAFEFFEWAEYIYLPDTVTAIGERAFYACGKVTEIRLPSGLQSVGGDAFRECGNLKALELPQNVEVIGDFTVRGCNKLEKLTIPETVTYLQESTVTSDLLTSIVIPSSVTRMDKDAFAYCDVLTTVIYQGTVAQWQAVEKHVQWCLHSNFFVIQCADGYVHAVTGEIVDTP